MAIPVTARWVLTAIRFRPSKPQALLSRKNYDVRSTRHSQALEAAPKNTGRDGHPRELATLVLTEFWERFSYYGMRAILILYMTAPARQGGLGFDTQKAASIYGTYTMAVYLTGLPGGFIADRILGARLAVLFGGIIIALGHFSMVATSLPCFYTGLILITLGTGLLKPNISTMVGDLYNHDDVRRDGGFSILYMGVSLGAAVAPLFCGYIAQDERFKQLLSGLSVNPLNSWHWGFAAAGVGMTFGLIQFTAPRRRLAHIGVKPRQRKASDKLGSHLTRDEWKHIGVIFILFFVYMLYSAVYEQSGSSLNLFADRLTRTEAFGWHFPSSWFQSVDSIYLLLLAPFFSMLWLRLGTRQPSIPAKFCFALLFQGLALLLMVPASMFASSGKVSPWWLLSVYFVDIIGWMCIGPIGASAVTKLAPPNLAGVMMGVWFLGIAFGSKIAGYLAGFFDDTNSGLLVKFFGSLGVAALIAAALLALSAPVISKLMGKVR